MYKGGCYAQATPPGQTICQTAGDTAGVCEACADGYFNNPGAANNVDSCISCGDATGVKVGSDDNAKTYKGVDGCKTCTLSDPATTATCTECATDLYLKTETGRATFCVASNACTGGFFPTTDTADSKKKKCLACSDENCDVCAASGANKCSKCKTSGDKIYLQKEADSQIGTCIVKASCTGTYYIDEEAKTCSACASAGTTGCKTCAKTDGVVTCTSCEDRQKFGLNKKSCVAECPDNASEKSGVCTCNAGFTPNEDSSACTQCHSSCLTCSAADENSCTACAEGTPFLGAAGNGPGKCVSCGDASSSTWKGVANCAKCNKPANENTPAVCTECTTNYYLKKDGSTTSCVAAGQCNNGFFPTTDSNNKKVCVSCSETNNGGIANCAKCSLKASSTRAGAAVTCTECSSNKLSPLGDACLAACPAGTYETAATTGSGKICALCHTSCSSCSDAGESSCTACYPGSVLNKIDSSTAGTCIPECTGRYAENCEAGMCTAVLGGSRYCSKCKSGYVPVDGLCVSATARAPNGCTPGTDGTCSACTGTYFKESGGCYKAGAFPGNAICTTAQNGACQTCTTTGQAPNSGVCPSCPDGCANCKTNTNRCDTCYSGYYLSNSKCFKCTTDSNEGSNAIKGVPNCVSCAAPASSGPVTCYVTQSPSVDPTDPSVNRGGLSSGAIAGISVAVIVVVGGLVGFLCWWFVCRGKA